MTRLNEYDLPIGPPVPNWEALPLPPHTAIEGRFRRLEPIKAKSHGVGARVPAGLPTARQ